MSLRPSDRRIPYDWQIKKTKRQVVWNFWAGFVCGFSVAIILCIVTLKP